jgi:hypothetical protein
MNQQPTLSEIIIKLHDIARERNIPELRQVADDVCQIEKRIRNESIQRTMGSNKLPWVVTEARSHAIL